MKLQIALICTILGKPTPEEMKHITGRTAQEFLAKLPDTRKISFAELLEANPHSAKFHPQVGTEEPSGRTMTGSVLSETVDLT